MDRLVRARVLLAEAEALGVTIDDLVAAASSSSASGSSPGGGSRRAAAPVPTLAEYVDTVAPSFSANTAATYRSYWQVAVARFGDRPIDSLDADDCEAVLADAVRRASQRRPGDGRSSRENCVAALRALFGRAERAGLLTKNPARELDKPRRRASRRRALDNTELAEALDAVRTAPPCVTSLGSVRSRRPRCWSRSCDPFGFARESKFARWSGTGAVALSSGEGDGPPARHRLDFRGNRRINSVLYIASVTQQRDHELARAYIARKAAEGKTAREARRAHKRHLANRVVRRMWADERRRTAAPPLAA